MFNWVLCVLCVFLSSYDYLKGMYPSVCVCLVCVCLVCVCVFGVCVVSLCFMYVDL